MADSNPPISFWENAGRSFSRRYVNENKVKKNKVKSDLREMTRDFRVTTQNNVSRCPPVGYSQNIKRKTTKKRLCQSLPSRQPAYPPIPLPKNLLLSPNTLDIPSPLHIPRHLLQHTQFCDVSSKKSDFLSTGAAFPCPVGNIQRHSIIY